MNGILMKQRSIFLIFLCIFVVALNGCGKTASKPVGGLEAGGGGGSFSSPSDFEPDGGGGTESGFPPDSFDPKPQIEDLKNGLQQIAGAYPGDNDKQQALLGPNGASNALNGYLDYFNALGNYNPAQTPRLIQLLAEAERRARLASQVLNGAGLENLGAVYEQQANTGLLFQVRDTRKSANRIYYVRELADLQSLYRRLGNGFKFDGPVFPVWKQQRPSVHRLLQFATRPIFGCEIKTGGTFVALDSNCERNTRTNRPASRLLGFVTTTAPYREVTIRRYKHRRNPFRTVVTTRGTNSNINDWLYQGTLGGAAYPISPTGLQSSGY